MAFWYSCLLNEVRPDPDAGFVAALAGTVAAGTALRMLELLGDTTEWQPFAKPAADGGVGTLCCDTAAARITLRIPERSDLEHYTSTAKAG